jgi:hypothetical protein
MEGTFKPNRRPDLARVVPRGAHHVLGGDLALVGGELPFAGSRAFDPGHLGLLVDLGAQRTGSLAQRHGEIGRRDVTVVGMIERPNNVRRIAAVAELGQRPELLDLLRRDDLKGHADGVRRPAILLILVHALTAGGEAHIAGDVETHVLSGLGGQALVEVHRVLVQLPDRVAHVEKRQEPRRVPGRAGGEFGALEKHGVRPALVSQMIERADADHAATDHHDAGMSFHLEDPRVNAHRSVTSGEPNKTLIATITCANAPPMVGAGRQVAASRGSSPSGPGPVRARPPRRCPGLAVRKTTGYVGNRQFACQLGCIMREAGLGPGGEAPWNRRRFYASANTRF